MEMTQKVICRGGRCVDAEMDCYEQFSDPDAIIACQRLKDELVDYS